MNSLNFPVLRAFFGYSRKVNDSNGSVNIRMDENNSSSRDDIETLNMSDSSSSPKLSKEDEIHPSDLLILRK